MAGTNLAPFVLSKSSFCVEFSMSSERGVRYRRLALTESDPEKTRLLHLIADESDRGVLVTSDRKILGGLNGEPPAIIAGKPVS